MNKHIHTIKIWLKVPSDEFTLVNSSCKAKPI